MAEENAAYIKNGKVAAFIDRHGYLFFYNDKGQELTRECIRNRNDLSEYSVPLGMQARFLHPNVGAMTGARRSPSRPMGTRRSSAWVSIRKIS